MASKVLVVLLLAVTASAVLGEKPSEGLERREGGLLSQVLGMTGSLTNTAVNKAVNMGVTSLSALNGAINYSADAMKSGANMLLRRDLGYDDITSMINRAQADMANSWRAANQLAREMLPSLPEMGRDRLDMYMNELKISQAHYNNALQNAAAYANNMLNNRIYARAINDQEDFLSRIQDNYSVEMIDYILQMRRLGNVIANNGFSM